MAQVHYLEHSLNSTTDSNNQIDSPSSLTKLYKSILNTEVVQTGLEKFNRVSGQYRRRVQDSRSTLYTKVADTVLSTTIYNKLSDLFLEQNLPVGSLSPGAQDFVDAFEAFDSNYKTIYRDLPLDFHQIASAEWRSLESSNFTGIRDVLLRTVARVLNKNLNLSDESLSQTLYTIFRTNLETGLPRESKFTKQVWEDLSETAKTKGADTVREAAKEYYTFARRFTFVDYPLKHGSEGWSGLAKTVVKRNAKFVSESSLTFIESKLDFVMNTVNVVYAGPKTANNLVERTERILRKMFVLALHPVKISAEKALALKDNKYYITADKYLNLTDRLDNALYYSLWGYDVLKDRVLVPTYDFVQVKVVKTRENIAYLLSGVNTEIVRRNLNKLTAKYEVLRRGTVSLYDQTIKLVLTRTNVKELGEKVQSELNRLLNEVRKLEVEKVKQNTLQLYKSIIEKFATKAKQASEKAKQVTERVTEKVTDKALEVVPTKVLQAAVDIVCHNKVEEKPVEAEIVAPVTETEAEKQVEIEVKETIELESKPIEASYDEIREAKTEETSVENHVEENHVEEKQGDESPVENQTEEAQVEETQAEENNVEGQVEGQKSKKSKKNKKKH